MGTFELPEKCHDCGRFESGACLVEDPVYLADDLKQVGSWCRSNYTLVHYIDRIALSASPRCPMLLRVQFVSACGLLSDRSATSLASDHSQRCKNCEALLESSDLVHSTWMTKPRRLE